MKLPVGSVNGRLKAAGWGAVLAGVLVLGVPPDAGAQSSGLPELEIVTADSADTGLPDKAVSAACPAGKTPLGGGAQVLGNIGHVFLQGSYRLNNTTWAAGAEALDQTNPWRVQVRAMCVPAGLASESGLEVIDAQSPDNSLGRKSAEAVCPSGKTVIGGGALVLGNIGHVFLQGNYRENDTTWVGFAEAVDQTNPWRVLSRAVCVSSGFAANRGLQVVTAESAHNAVADKSAGAKCPAGKTAVGGGALMFGNNGQVFLQKSQPEDATTWAVLAESLRTDPWHITAQVICVGAPTVPPTEPTVPPTAPTVPPTAPTVPDNPGGGSEAVVLAETQEQQIDPTTPGGGVQAGAGGTAQHGFPVLPVAAGPLGVAVVGCALRVQRRTRR